MKGKAHMKKTLVLTIVIALLSSILCSACSQEIGSQNWETMDKIRNATVLITMELPKMNENLEKSILIGYGIGSLVEYEGEILLVTHNHWHEVMTDASIVKLYNSENRQIKAILGMEWRNLIVYADAGTLVLRPPQELIDELTPIKVEAAPQVVEGDTVEVVYREGPSRETAAIKQAVVEEIMIYKDEPVYKLRSLDGQVIQPGDSGGGIWYEGSLIGNNWTVTAKSYEPVESTDNSAEENLAFTDISYAAVLPEVIP
jgi:hypothetical protein